VIALTLVHDRDDGKLDLDNLRQQIDELDLQILRLLNERMAIVERIAALKRQAGIEVQDHAREEAVLRRLEEENSGPLSREQIEGIFRQIIMVSRAIQSRYVNEGP
jgi:chorismate mutase-like protein